MNPKQRLFIQQNDNRMKAFKEAAGFTVPENGWIHSIRKCLGMNYRQLAVKLGISAQGAKDIEAREANDSITLRALKEAGEAMDMTLVYGFVSKHGSLEKMIEDRAHEIAEQIVNRTSQTMKLENQENSKVRLYEAIEEKTMELKESTPKYLWD